MYDREKSRILFFSGEEKGKKVNAMEVALDDPALEEILGEKKAATLRDDVELLGAGREFDMESVRNGSLSPVFFGSALTTFGVEPFLEEFLRMTTPPLSRTADCGEIDVFSEDFSAFVFKIQANMNKAHRDRLAFMRICSGHFQRDKEYYHMQSGKKMRLSQPQTMMAAEREIVEEAYAGDIISVFDPGLFSIGDTITVPGKKFKYSGIPTFEPEHFMRVSPKNTMKRKQFIKGTEQIAQEGAIQIFKVPDSGLEEVIVGVVGTLQFDVFEYRMKNEYGVELYTSCLPYEHLRHITACPMPAKDLVLCTGAALLEDFKGPPAGGLRGEWLSLSYQAQPRHWKSMTPCLSKPALMQKQQPPAFEKSRGLLLYCFMIPFRTSGSIPSRPASAEIPICPGDTAAASTHRHQIPSPTDTPAFRPAPLQQLHSPAERKAPPPAPPNGRCGTRRQFPAQAGSPATVPPNVLPEGGG